jgi:hypothetical protein
VRLVVDLVVGLVVGETYLFDFECVGFGCGGSEGPDLINLPVDLRVVEVLG